MPGFGFGFSSATLRRPKRYNRFSPASLFANGEAGAWYDPSDLSTMFQDDVGSIPVTATGQQVGLILDKRKGLALGPDLVTNGGFTSASGWALGSGWAISGGVAVKSENGGSGSGISQILSLEVGKMYEIRFRVTGTNGSIVNARFTGGTTVLGASAGDGTLDYVTRIVAVTGNTTLFIAQSAPNGGCVVDNVSVRELMGNHAKQTATSQRPVYGIDVFGSSYLQFDGVNDVLVMRTPVDLATIGGLVATGLSERVTMAGLGTILSQGGAGYINVSQTSGIWQKNDGGTNLAVINTKDRQAVSLITSNSGRTLTGTDSVGATGSATANSNGLSAASLIGRFTETASAPLAARLHGILIRVGLTTTDQENEIRKYYARQMRSVTS